jgi:hypothetical protein
MTISMQSARESLREAARKCVNLVQRALLRLKRFVLLLGLPKNEDVSNASGEVIEQVSVPKKRRSGSKGRQAGQTGSRNRVQRKAKGSSKKR